MVNDETETGDVITTVRDGVGLLKINRPEKMNAFTTEVLHGLTHGVESFEEDDDVRAILLTGAGDDAFCAGVDLGGDEEILAAKEDLVESVRSAQLLLQTLRESELPVIGAINGYAFGAGLDIALGTDIRIIRADTEVSESYVNIGLVPGDGGAHLLPRLVGESRAKELILTGKRVSGVEAADMGLATTAVEGDAERTRSAGQDLATDFASGATVAIGRAKAMINQSHARTLEDSLEDAIEGIEECYETEDYRTAVEAFNEGRSPEFAGE